MSASDLVSIETFVNRVEADLAHGALAAAGIDSMVSADDAGGTYAGALTRGVRLLVRSEDANRARDVLSQAVELDNGIPDQ
jgi:hypothetical protein